MSNTKANKKNTPKRMKEVNCPDCGPVIPVMKMFGAEVCSKCGIIIGGPYATAINNYNPSGEYVD